MSRPTDRIRSKLARANEHIEYFEVRARAFGETNPCTIGFKVNADTNQRTFYVAAMTEIPDVLAAIAADAIQNLRSPLDHIAYQLEVRGAGGVVPKHRVYFPIADSATQYPSLRDAYIKRAGQPAIDAIDATEPYRDGRGHTLWQMHALNKPDKHRFPLVASGSYEGVDISGFLIDSMAGDMPQVREMRPALGPLFLKPADRLCPLKVGDELWGEPASTKMHEDRKFAFGIALHEPGVIECQPVLKTLKDMANLIRGIVDSFEPLLT